jgi:hypothetical protein
VIKFLVIVSLVALVIAFVFRTVVLVFGVDAEYPARVVITNSWWGTFFVALLLRGWNFIHGN